MRVVSRRDLTVAIGHGKTYLGSVCVWVGSEEEQKYRLAKIIKEQKQVALGLTEKAHGSDLIANEVEATEVEDGYLLTGEKWLINNATRGKALTVFARTDSHGTSRSFSTFFVEKDKLKNSSYRHLEKIRTHGIRGADISGISFDKCLIPKESLIGKLGAGLEVTLKGFQITRTICASLSLGAADTALRSTLDFALSRKLYGENLFAVPHAQQQLVEAFLDILICDCVATAATRAIHVTTEQMSVWSAVVKYFVPITVEKLIYNLGVVLGARYYLRESHWWGIFQKIVRDNAIVSLFDGSTIVNLYALSLQLRHLAKHRTKIDICRCEDLLFRLENTFSLDRTLPDANLNNLELFNRGHNDVLQGIELSLVNLKKIQNSSEIDNEILQVIINFTSNLLNLLKKNDEIVKDLPAQKGHKEPPELFEMSRQYCLLHTAAACLHMWLYNRQLLGDFFAQGKWLVLCLDRLMMPFLHTPSSLPDSYRENVAQELLKLYKQDQLFSIVPIQLAKTKA
jgi:alkylation response protein AidB-like acyl-CoA dehydrogenase